VENANDFLEHTNSTCEVTIIVGKPPRNSAEFCGGGQGLNWAVEPRKEGRKEVTIIHH
jgi:hypothetical protein